MKNYCTILYCLLYFCQCYECAILCVIGCTHPAFPSNCELFGKEIVAAGENIVVPSVISDQYDLLIYTFHNKFQI